MSAIKFPFWILMPLNATDGACSSPDHVSTFSTAARAIAFMETCEEGEWDVKLVSRTSRPELEEFLNGITTVCHDQNADGSGGTEITVEELLAGWAL